MWSNFPPNHPKDNLNFAHAWQSNRSMSLSGPGDAHTVYTYPFAPCCAIHSCEWEVATWNLHKADNSLSSPPMWQCRVPEWPIANTRVVMWKKESESHPLPLSDVPSVSLRFSKEWSTGDSSWDGTKEMVVGRCSWRASINVNPLLRPAWAKHMFTFWHVFTFSCLQVLNTLSCSNKKHLRWFWSHL